MNLQPKSGSLISILVLGSGNVIGTVISAVALIIFSRFLGPTEFGLFSAALAAMQIVVRLADFGTNMATERSLARAYGKDKSQADRLIRVGFWLKILSYTICVILGLVLAPWIAHSFLHLDNVGLIRLAFLLSGGTVFFEYTTILFQASHRFGIVARITIAQAIGKLGFGLLMLWQGLLNSTTAILIYGLLPGIGALLGWIKSPFTTFALPKTWKKELKIILSVAKWTGIAVISATLADNLDTLMVQSFMSSYDTGIWSGAVRIATFGSLLGWTVGSVLSNRVARYHDPVHLKAYLRKAWKISLLSFLALCAGIPLAKLAVVLTIGPAYLSAVLPLQILLIATGISAAITPYSSLFYLFDRPEYYAYTGIISTAILLLGDYFLIPIYGLMGAAYVRIGVKFLTYLFTLFYVRQSLKHHLSYV